MAAIAVALLVDEVGEGVGEPVAVSRVDASDGVFVIVVILELIELVELDELEELDVEAADVVVTMLGREVCTTSVAVMTVCVFDKAFGCPLHILYPFSSTVSDPVSSHPILLKRQHTSSIITSTEPHIILRNYTLYCPFPNCVSTCTIARAKTVQRRGVTTCGVVRLYKRLEAYLRTRWDESLNLWR